MNKLRGEKLKDRGVVLIAEKHHLIKRSLKERLETSGWQIAQATSGGEAIQFLAGMIPDLLIIEHELTDINGCEVIRRLRNKKTLPKTMLVAERPHVANLARIIGISHFIGKPFDPDEVTSALARL